MGSKSRNRTQQSTNNQATNVGLTTGGDGSIIHGDGNTQIDQSGATIDNSVDNSDNSVTTTEIDNSNNSVNEYDYSQTDNSVHEYDYSTQYNGEYAGVQGNVTVTDGGAFDVVSDMSDNLLAGMTAISSDATQTARDAIGSIESVAEVSNAQMAALAQNLTETSLDNYESLGQSVLSQSISAISSGSQDAIKAATDAMERNAKLVQTTNLQGQDLIVDQAVNMTKVMVGGLLAVVTVGGVFVLIKAKKS